MISNTSGAPVLEFGTTQNTPGWWLWVTRHAPPVRAAVAPPLLPLPAAGRSAHAQHGGRASAAAAAGRARGGLGLGLPPDLLPPARSACWRRAGRRPGLQLCLWCSAARRGSDGGGRAQLPAAVFNTAVVAQTVDRSITWSTKFKYLLIVRTRMRGGSLRAHGEYSITL
eukprot:SAG31_NODE_2795_length_5082_cov_2.673289_1_plen_169_part_00